jgi:hypothetical protein
MPFLALKTVIFGMQKTGSFFMNHEIFFRILKKPDPGNMPDPEKPTFF